MRAGVILTIKYKGERVSVLAENLEKIISMTDLYLKIKSMISIYFTSSLDLDSTTKHQMP